MDYENMDEHMESVAMNGYWTCSECGNNMEVDGGDCRCGAPSPFEGLI